MEVDPSSCSITEKREFLMSCVVLPFLSFALLCCLALSKHLCDSVIMYIWILGTLVRGFSL